MARRHHATPGTDSYTCELQASLVCSRHLRYFVMAMRSTCDATACMTDDS